MADPLVMDEAPCLEKGRIRTNGYRTSLYSFPHKSFIVRFHHFHPLFSTKFILHLAKNQQKSARLPGAGERPWGDHEIFNREGEANVGKVKGDELMCGSTCRGVRRCEGAPGSHTMGSPRPSSPGWEISPLRLRSFLFGRRLRLSFGIIRRLLHGFQSLLCHFRLVGTWKSFDDPSEKISGIRLIPQFQEGEGLFE